MYDAFQALQQEAASYPDGVRIWMRVMGLSFFAGIVFAPWRREALWVVLMAASTLVLLVVGKNLDPSLSRSMLGSVIHLLLWPAVLWLLWSPAARARRSALLQHGLWHRVFRGWLAWVTALILISLVLDAKFLALQALGG